MYNSNGINNSNASLYKSYTNDCFLSLLTLFASLNNFIGIDDVLLKMNPARGCIIGSLSVSSGSEYNESR